MAAHLLEQQPESARIAARRLRVVGTVQGVGFRPYIYRLARQHGVSGWVLNDGEGVLIHAEGTPRQLRAFTQAIVPNQPVLARVKEVRLLQDYGFVPEREHVDFDIAASVEDGTKGTTVPADSHVCDACLAELFTPGNRRYRYPFINCTNCGPRFSLIRGLPYDRAKTTMAGFQMCRHCQSEYDEPGNRRFHAQPNACPECGPGVALSDGTGPVGHGDSAVAMAIDALLAGKVVAIKSVGGFHLAVDAQNGTAVDLLRRRKRRDAKPFAVMADTLATARRYVEIDPHEGDLLCSFARPIVLLRKRLNALPSQIAPGNPNLGVMLASAPLHYLLLANPALPVLVMTSGNVSGQPIAFRNETALEQLFSVADLVLHHDREIETRVDDSVIRCSTHPGLDRPVLSFIRRSRGYAPYPVEVAGPLHNIVAYGAELKTTVALTQGRHVLLSQHIGDLKNDETFASHQACIEHLGQLFDIQPHWVACDMHPSFRSSRFAKERGQDRIVHVQHHHAHMASCMAENGLNGTTLGVIFDGAGYGPDQTIWGGEFLLGSYASAQRVAHLRAMPLLGGDKAVHEPWRIAFALAARARGDVGDPCAGIAALEALDSQQRHVMGTMFKRGINSVPTSSMGRLFDGVAAMLGICSRAEYEAHGPIAMEALLQRNLDLAEPYDCSLNDADGMLQIDPDPLIRQLLSDLASDVAVAHISRRFHSTVVEITCTICTRMREAHQVNQVVLSGGVFLNEFLLVNTLQRLQQLGFSAHCHRTVPTNDGGIALGQVAVANAVISQFQGNP